MDLNLQGSDVANNPPFVRSWQAIVKLALIIQKLALWEGWQAILKLGVMMQKLPLDSGKHQGEMLARLGDLHESIALQHENQQHLARQFTLAILTPLQFCDLLLASGPYLLNIPATLISPLLDLPAHKPIPAVQMGSSGSGATHISPLLDLPAHKP